MSHIKKPKDMNSKSIRDALSSLVNFGPEEGDFALPHAPTALSANANDRLKALLKKLEELNRRVDHLSKHY